jgi:hypothetical protein
MYYYEILHVAQVLNTRGVCRVLRPGVYCTPVTTMSLMAVSERVWSDSFAGVNKVEYIKNRPAGGCWTVDMAEFLWVKLTAKMV